MLPRLKFRHRIGLLLLLAAVALIAVTIVTLVLGRRSERQLTGIETRYVPLIELDRDLKRIAAELTKALEDAAGAGEESKLEEADRLKAELLARLAEGRQAIIDNGADPAALAASFAAYYPLARELSVALIDGKSAAHLTAEIEAMRRARDAFMVRLDVAARPDRKRLRAAFATARDSQEQALIINIIVACVALVLMAVLSRRIIHRTVKSLWAVAEGVERLAGGDFSKTIDVAPGDELGDLAREANRAAVRLREYREHAERETERAHTALIEAQRQAREAETANKELEAFSYSVSHDLRGPLRGIDGFSQALIEDAAERLTPEDNNHLRRIRAGAQRMGELIDDLLRLSRVSRGNLKKEHVDLSALVHVVLGELRKTSPDRNVSLVVQNSVRAYADPRLIRITLENLLGNAWKFTSKKSEAQIEFGARNDPEGVTYFVRDNGAGFDMQYVDRLFGAFQRLHTDKEFPGTGIGLATVQRIVRRHGGKIWVEASPGHGATFFVTLPGES